MFVEIDMEKLRHLVDEREFTMNWAGYEITDPFYDQFGREPVHPVEYYGDAFIKACLEYGLFKYQDA